MNVHPHVDIPQFLSLTPWRLAHVCVVDVPTHGVLLGMECLLTQWEVTSLEASCRFCWCAFDPPIPSTLILAFGFQLMLKLLPVTAEGVEILKTSLPPLEPWNFSQHSCMYVGVCSGMVGPTAWYNVNDIYIWCVEMLLKELCSIVEFSAILWFNFC